MLHRLPQLHVWILATRPKTLVASISPVVMGLAIVYSESRMNWALAAATLLSACSLQIGTNFVNDLYDFLKGGDQSDRIGPTRTLQAGMIPASQMRLGIGIAFLVCMASGALLVRAGGLFILWIGLFGIGMGILYTAGPWPLAYNGWSDLMVLLFFGVLAVAGTVFVQTGQVDPRALVAGISPGLISTGILVVNNLRDVEQDTRSGRRNLIIRFGLRFGQLEYLACMLGAMVVPIFLYRFASLSAFTVLPSVCLLPVLPTAWMVWTKKGPVLNRALARTAAILLLFSLLFCVGWVFGR